MVNFVISVLLSMVALAALGHAAFVFDGNVTVGLSLSLTNMDGSAAGATRMGLGRDVRDAIQVSLDVFNANGGVVMVDGTRREMKAIIYDDGAFTNASGPVFVRQHYRRLCDQARDGQVNLILGPVNTDFTGPAMAITETCNGGTPILYTTAANHAPGTNPRSAFSVLAPGDTAHLTAMQLLALNGASSAVVIQEESAKQLCTSVISQAPGFGMKIVHTLDIATATSLTPAQQAALDEVVLKAKRANADVLFACAYPGNAGALLLTMKKFNWYPKAISIVPNNAQFAAMVSQRAAAKAKGLPYEHMPDVEYSLAGTAWHEDANYRPSYPFGTVKEFVGTLKQKLGKSAPDWGYYAMGAASMQVAYAMFQKTPSLASSDVAFTLSRTQVDTVFGQESFLMSGLSSVSFICSQWYQDIRRVVAPITSRSFIMVYPAPTWEERVFAPKFLGTSAELGIFAFAVVCIVVLLAMAGCIWWYRNERIIKAASWQMCVVMILGAALTCSSVMVWQPYATDALCHAQIWLFGVGETLWVGSILVKTLRIHQIFNATVLRVTKGTSRMLGTFAAILAVDVILLLIWSIGFPPSAQQYVIDSHRPALNYLACSTPSDAIAPVYIAWKVLIVLIATVLAFRVRNVPGEFNESRVIALGTYNFLLCGAIIIIVVAFNSTTTSASGRLFTFLFRSIGILLVALADMAIIFGPRLYTIWFDKTYTGTASGSNGTVINTGSDKNPGGRYKQNNYMHSAAGMSIPEEANTSKPDRQAISVCVEELARDYDELLKSLDLAESIEVLNNKRGLANVVQKHNCMVAHRAVAAHLAEIGSGTPRSSVPGAVGLPSPTSNASGLRGLRDQFIATRSAKSTFNFSSETESHVDGRPPAYSNVSPQPRVNDTLALQDPNEPAVLVVDSPVASAVPTPTASNASATVAANASAT